MSVNDTYLFFILLTDRGAGETEISGGRWVGGGRCVKGGGGGGGGGGGEDPPGSNNPPLVDRN